MSQGEEPPTPTLETEVLRHLAREWKLDLDGWRDYESNFTTPVCTWFGITCDKDVVIGIQLPRVNLSGSINAELGILQHLQFIDLSENSIYGNIPDEIRRHRQLKDLNLAFNQIEGVLHQFQPVLEVLNVSHNELSGPLASDFGTESGNLKVFDASHNRIGGVIPPSLGRMSGLKLLDLGFNMLYGTIPAMIGDLKELQGLFINDNKLMGTIPLSFTREGLGLVQVFMEHNDLSGTVPSDLANLKDLKDLYLDGNKFTGTVPFSLCVLDLNQNFLTEDSEGRDGCNSIACPINNFSPEGVFPCSPCGPQGTSPYLGHDKKCYHLNEKHILDIFYEKTNGPMWKDSSGWGVDNVGVCNYKGVECNTAGHIISLNLPNNGLSGEIVEEIGMLRHLRGLDLSDNNLTGYLPSGLRFPPLEVLGLANNKLEGYIPPMLCLAGNVNGNGMNGHFNCDVIACPPGSWSPIGRSSPSGVEQDEEIYECKPCHRHGSAFLGSRQCGGVLVGGDRGGSFVGITAPKEDLLWTIISLIGIIGILVLLTAYRTRKTRQRQANRVSSLGRLNDMDRSHGSDTDSYCTEATETHSVNLTKLDPDDVSIETADDEIGGGLDSQMFSKVNDLDEKSVETRTANDTRADERSRSSRRSTRNRSQQRDEERSSRQNVEFWLDVPSI